MKFLKYFAVSLFLFTGCSSLTLKPANFSWPVEAVLVVNNDGFVNEERHSISFNTKDIFIEEIGDSLSFKDKEIRIIRDIKGYYYITSEQFKNVYVFYVDDGLMRLDNKILISETGINKPSFNQRPPNIELLNGGSKYLLSNKGIRNQVDDDE